MAHNNATVTSEGAHYLCHSLRRVTSDIPIRPSHEPQLIFVHLRLSCDLVFADVSPSRLRVRRRRTRSTTEVPSVPVTNAEWRRLKKQWLRLFRGESQVGPATSEQAGDYSSHAFYVTGRLERTQTKPEEPKPDSLDILLFVATDTQHRDRWVTSIRIAVDPLEKLSLSASETTLREAILASMSPPASGTSPSSGTGGAGPSSVVADENQNSKLRGEKLISKIAEKMMRGAETMDETSKVFGITASSVTKVADVVDEVFVGQPFVGAAVHVVAMAVKAGVIAAEVSQMPANLKSCRDECNKISHRIVCEMLATMGSTQWANDYYERLKQLLLSVEDMTRTIERACLANIFERLRLRETAEALDESMTKINEQLDAVESFGHIKLICEENSVMLKNIHNIVGRLDAPATLRKAKSGSTKRLDALRALGKRSPPEVPSTYVPGIDDPERLEYKLKRALLSLQVSQRPTAPRVVVLGIGGSGKSTACMAVAAEKDVVKHYGDRVIWLLFGDTSGTAMLNEAVTTIVSVICGAETAATLSDLNDSEFMSAARDLVASESRKSEENILFVLDDVWNVIQLQALLGLLPNRFGVVVTTRLPMAADAMGGAEEIVVERLPGHAARELLAKRMGRWRPDICNEEWFTKSEEEEFVQSIMKETDQLPLALDIIGCIVKSNAGAWTDVLKLLQDRSVANVRFEYPTEAVNHRTIHRSIRAALQISVEFLGGGVLLKSFLRLGILPSDATVVNSALRILWGEEVLEEGPSQAPERFHNKNLSSLDLVESLRIKEGAPDGHHGDGSVETKTDRMTFRELESAAVSEIIRKLRGNGLANVTVERGEMRGIRIHTAVRAFALELLRERGHEVEVHAQLLTGYGARHGFILSPGDDLMRYPLWELEDDGYVYENIARHAEKACNVAIATQFADSRWESLRDWNSPGVAYQADVEYALRTLKVSLRDPNRIQDLEDGTRAELYRSLGVLYNTRREGDPSANVDSGIQCYQEAFNVYTPEAYPRNWALTKMNLANALQEKQNGDSVENIKKAVISYEKALQVFTFDEYPRDWALTKLNMAVALRRKHTGDPVEDIDRAVKCFEEALQVYTFEEYPSDWALTKMNMAIALLMKLNGDPVENIEGSVNYCNEALKVYTFEAYPKNWARTKLNMAMALQERQTGDPIGNIEKAMKCYEEALQVYTLEVFPRNWALTKMNMANALHEKQNGNRLENLENAVECYEEALQVFTPEVYPRDWGLTMMNMATALQCKLIEDEVESIGRALKCYQEVLQVFTLETYPKYWALIKMNIGCSALQKKNGDPAENIESAVKCFEEALQVYTLESYPSYWAKTKLNIASALHRREKGDAIENVDRALECCEDALQVYKLETYPKNWAQAKYIMAIALQEKQNEDPIENNERALKCCEEALRVYTSEVYPRYWALTKLNMAGALHKREKGDAVENVERAAKCCEDVLSEPAEEISPEIYADVRRLLEDLRSN